MVNNELMILMVNYDGQFDAYTQLINAYWFLNNCLLAWLLTIIVTNT